MTKNTRDPTSAASDGQRLWLPQPLRITEQTWPDGAIPLVSICSLAYNHETFIRECLEGFLMQETTFPVEILIHDDASTDNTANIIREYEKQYPQIIKPIYQKENQYSKRAGLLHNILFPRAKGKYIALCEGDDYWTAPTKLQTQVDFMESHPDYSGCFHNVNIQDEAKGMYPMFSTPLKDTFTIQDLVLANRIPALSNVFRARLFPEFPAWYGRMPIGDWPLHVLNAEHGDIGYIDQNLGTYRMHGGSVWSSLSALEIFTKNIQVSEAIDAHLGFKYTKAISRNIAHWHYLIAMQIDRNGVGDNTIFTHLRSSIRHCFFHDDISKKVILILLIKHSCPTLYKWLKQVQKMLSN